MFDITAIGEALIDLTQTGLSASGVAEYAANPGGAPANLAVAAAKLGASTAFIGRVGADAFGTQLRECLRANGVDVSRMLTDAQRPTTLAVVSLDSRGERSFSFYRQHSADLALSPDDVPDEALRSTHFFHFGGVSLTANPARDTVLDAARRARNLGACVTYDPNYRPTLWGSHLKTIGKMLDSVVVLEGFFTTVLRAQVDPAAGRFYFSTRNDGHDTVKAPVGMFEAAEIDNDLAAIDEIIKEYYGITNNKENEE